MRAVSTVSDSYPAPQDFAAGADPSQVATHHKRVFIESFGCQMNDYDVERMTEVLRRDGFERTEVVEEADMIVVNTCSIREKAENKAASAAGRYQKLKERNPNLLVAIGGCVAQQEGEALLKRIPSADLTFGPDQIPNLAAHYEKLRPQPQTESWPQTAAKANRYRLRLAQTEVIDVEDYQFLDADPRPSDVKVTALVTIQKGCDNFCAYCIVPRTRGREVSRPADQVVREVARFVAMGSREVTLIGQNVNDWNAGRRRLRGAAPARRRSARTSAAALYHQPSALLYAQGGGCVPRPADPSAVATSSGASGIDQGARSDGA